MKIFTLTNDRNYEEITKFIENKITEKDQIIVWTYSLPKKFRLEVNTGCKVEGGSRYEESVSSTSSLTEYFPFDVINLDFSSQDPISENGRIEREIKSLEETIKLQREKQGEEKGFTLIYTTLLNSCPIDKEQVIRYSNAIQITGGSGFQLSNFQNNINEQNEKMEFIKKTLEEIFSKYSYITHKLDKANFRLSNEQKVIFSAIGIIKKGV